MEERAMSKKPKQAGLIIQDTHRNMWEGLPHESCGELLKALMAYQFDGVVPDFYDLRLKVAFDFLKPVIDKQKDDYQEKCEKNAKNIQDHWDKVKGVK